MSDVDAFRAEVRAWLDAHVPRDLRGATLADADDPARLAALRAWNAALADAGYAGLAWPAEYGGRAASVEEQVVLAEELSRAEAPPSLNPIGLSNIAPAIMTYGTDAQRARHLRRMLRADDIWCQGFSEPDAGSDLASLRTSAVLDGDHFVVNGQKVWTTLGHVADWCELLVRTHPSAPKHKGISALLVDMTLPGIEVQPLVTITGDREFNALFFTDVRVPVECLLGPVNEGWRVAVTTLANERAGVANLHLSHGKKLARVLAAASANGAASDAVDRQRLASAVTDHRLLELLAGRAVSRAAAGQPPGPEGSLAKLVWSLAGQDLAETAGAVLGEEGLAGAWGRDALYSRSLTIAGGTTEVNKNLLAERILGLPRDVAPPS
ncbi:MAG: acyl-CoA dehydrogenase family protein [Actinobacteria bacterium]|nr:acyl-CoA dehydrogenase family protein [Actinomycetota bacterium]